MKTIQSHQLLSKLDEKQKKIILSLFLAVSDFFLLQTLLQNLIFAVYRQKMFIIRIEFWSTIKALMMWTDVLDLSYDLSCKKRTSEEEVVGRFFRACSSICLMENLLGTTYYTAGDIFLSRWRLKFFFCNFVKQRWL